ncbi:MAG: hypothetical protein DME97_12430 [Verrucomicrobia bacterium]|nr:MAG: hypothetical protein DME97_12430 [Verrucomicrobiota bacterium]
MVTLTDSEGIPIRGPEAAPAFKEALERFNADAAAWNRRCTITHSEAEQFWCEEERARLESRKAKLTAGAANSSAYVADNPAVEITLRQRTKGKIVKQVKTDANGTFMMGTFPAGIYTLEFRAKSAPEVKNQSFAIKIAGTKSRGSEKSFAGRYFVGGLALDIETVPGTPLRGLITPSSTKNTKKMIWLPQQIGSNLPAHWVEEGSSQAVAAYNWGHISIESIRKMQDHGDRP